MEKKTDQKHNRKRASYVSLLKRKNIKLVKELVQHIDKDEMDEKAYNVARSTVKALRGCCNFSLYGQNKLNADIKYIASVNCKKKVCFVCNWMRQKQLRRKYYRWFDDNQYLGLIRTKKRKLQAKTLTQIESKDFKLVRKVEYDLMHLTLTVPHYAGSGFRGEKYYFKEIAKLYHCLRNESLLEINGKKYRFDELVYGGEYGIECTAGHYEKMPDGSKVRRLDTNGLNIHIHSLLFVKKMFQSRNKLHRALLLEWNRITVNEFSNRESLTDFHKKQIKKGNSLLTDSDIEQLQPKGATLIGLESIFVKDTTTGEKVRSKTFGDIAMKRAVMETISYHFEPLAFDKADDTIDIELMLEIMPKVYGMALFSKFGCLRGEKSLNITDKELSVEDEFAEVSEMLVDTDTGELIASDDFFITSPANIFAIKEDENKLILKKDTKNVINFSAENSRTAVKVLADTAQKYFKK